MKYQGLVGVLGDGGKTRLTWLVNMNFGGLVPSSFTSVILKHMMSYPISITEELQSSLRAEESDAPKGAEGLDESGPVPREAFEKMQRRLKKAEARAETLQGELKNKDSEIDRLGGVISELRKRKVAGEKTLAGSD